MSPAEELRMWHEQFQAFRRKVYWLITIGFSLIMLGFFVIAAAYITGQENVHRVSCANSQTLITQYEFLRKLAIANQTGALTKAQVQQREMFYSQAENLALERAGPSCKSLTDMKAQAQIDINKVFHQPQGG